MTTEIHKISCKCDICKAVYEVDKKEQNPLKKVRLPMIRVVEGHIDGYALQDVEVCAPCMEQMEGFLSQHYDMRSIDWVGAEITVRKE